MRHIIIIIILLTNQVIIFGQGSPDKQRILEFKNDFLDKVDMYELDTLLLDTLMLTRVKYPDVRLIRTFTKNKNIVLYEYYFNGTTKIESTFTYDTTGKLFGISKQFNEKGTLDYIQDYDKGKWIVYNNKDYPFYKLQNLMKLKADGLISKMYGNNFLINHTIWSISGSAIYNDQESGNWTDKFKSKPTKFLFRYDVKLDNKVYDELIEFELDSKGKFIPNEYEEIFGFEKIPENYKGAFKLTYNEAIKIAKQKGLLENDTIKAVSILSWECFKTPNIFNGHFRFYIMIKTNQIENIVENGRSSRITKFDVYSFNPWTGDFIEKKKMKSVYSWEKMSGSGTGLIPDN